MKINDNALSALEYNKSLEEKLKNVSKAKKDEIERVKGIYDKKIEMAKSTGEDRFANTLTQNENKIIAANADYEEKLQSYKNALDKTEKSLAQDELSQKKDHDERMKNLKEHSANILEDEVYKARDIEHSVADQMRFSIGEIQKKSSTEQSHLESQARNHLTSIAANFNQKINNEDKDFRNNYNELLQTHAETLRIKKNEFKDELDKNIEKARETQLQKKQVQTNELTFLENHQKDLLAQKTKDFQSRYDLMVNEHESILSDLKAHLENDLKKMIESSTVSKKDVQDKIEDHFYRVETLKPALTETMKDLIVSLKVPEFEKENVHLSVHGRDLKLTLNRKFSEIMEASDGSSNKSTRSELFSKEFSTNDILNPKQISQKYEKGVLTFKISKL